MVYTGGAVAFDSAVIDAKPLEDTGGISGGKDRTRISSREGSGFEEKLHKIEMDDLMQKLDLVAERVFRFPSAKVLEDYRAMVGRIIECAGEMIGLRRDFSVRSGKAGFLIERTKKGLDELEDVLGREGRRSRVMGITREIKGCLLSLVA
ncbi:MAG: DUF327 family protein [Thermovirga sp.]